jgi:hypothetical protein
MQQLVLLMQQLVLLMQQLVLLMLGRVQLPSILLHCTLPGF